MVGFFHSSRMQLETLDGFDNTAFPQLRTVSARWSSPMKDDNLSCLCKNIVRHFF